MSDLGSKKEINPESGISTDTTKPQKNRKKLTLFVPIAIAVFVLGITAVYINDKYIANNNYTSSVCSDRNEGSILYKANLIFKENKETVTKAQVDSLIQDIKETKGYSKDANCLYPIMFGYILDSDFKTANEEYDEFAKVYGDGSSFAKDIYPMQNIDEFKSLIEFSLKIQSDNTIKPTPNNVIGAGEQVREIPENELR